MLAPWGSHILPIVLFAYHRPIQSWMQLAVYLIDSRRSKSVQTTKSLDTNIVSQSLSASLEASPHTLKLYWTVWTTLAMCFEASCDQSAATSIPRITSFESLIYQVFTCMIYVNLNWRMRPVLFSICRSCVLLYRIWSDLAWISTVHAVTVFMHALAYRPVYEQYDIYDTSPICFNSLFQFSQTARMPHIGLHAYRKSTFIELISISSVCMGGPPKLRLYCIYLMVPIYRYKYRHWAKRLCDLHANGDVTSIRVSWSRDLTWSDLKLSDGTVFSSIYTSKISRN